MFSFLSRLFGGRGAQHTGHQGTGGASVDSSQIQPSVTAPLQQFEFGPNPFLEPLAPVDIQRLPPPMQVFLHCLSQVPGHEHVALRGSAGLLLTCPGPTRIPDDLDFVVTDLEVYDPQFEELIRQACQYSLADNFPYHFIYSPTRVEELWEYSESPGVRFILAYTNPGESRERVLQADFAEESLVTPHAAVEFGFPHGDTRINVCSFESALAWKLRWLIEDGFVEPNDLYDAALLLAGGTFRPQVFQQAFLSVFDEADLGYDEIITMCDVEHLRDFDARMRRKVSHVPLEKVYYLHCHQMFAAKLPDLLRGTLHIPSPEEYQFLTNIRNDRNDMAAKLIFADWLEEQHDPRGEYLRYALNGDDSTEMRELGERLDVFWRQTLRHL